MSTAVTVTGNNQSLSIMQQVEMLKKANDCLQTEVDKTTAVFRQQVSSMAVLNKTLEDQNALLKARIVHLEEAEKQSKAASEATKKADEQRIAGLQSTVEDLRKSKEELQKKLDNQSEESKRILTYVHFCSNDSGEGFTYDYVDGKCVHGMPKYHPTQRWSGGAF